MKLHFIGRGSAFNPKMGNTGAFFEKDGDLFLLDCGESIYERLMKLMDLKSFRQIYVILTHLHADHVGSLGSLISYNYCILGRRTTIIHPLDTVVALLNLLGIKSEFYHYLPRLPLVEGGLSVLPVPVKHVDNMECFGYLIEDGDEAIYYSGDAAEIPGDILNSLKAGRIDRLYQDTSSCDVPNPGHCYIGFLEKNIPQELRNRVYCMHLDCDFRKEITDLGFRFVELAES